MYYDYTFKCPETNKKVIVTSLSIVKAEREAEFLLKCKKVILVTRRNNFIKTIKGV